jgi:hypothetical protein
MFIKKVAKILLVFLCLPIILLWVILCGDAADIILLIKEFVNNDRKFSKEDLKRMTR